AGKVIGFGARTMKSGEQPKYLNSPETEVYHKSEVLYGIFQAKNAIRQADNCYLCEGYTDVISLHQAGVANAVASSGTSLTEGQIRLIKRFTQAVTVLYDGDPAGIKASLRGIDLLLAEGLSVRALLFPSGEDPDSYARKVGPAAFKDFLAAQAQDFLTFKTQLLLQDAAHDPIRRAGVVRDVVGSISKIPDAIQREVFVKQCARLLDVGEETLVLEINKLIISGQQKENERLAQAKERARAIKNPGRRAEGPPSEGPPPPTDEYAPLPTDEYAPPEAPWPDEIPLPDGVMLAGFGPKITRIVEQYEQACVRLLLRFGNHHVDLAADIKLWQYLFQELEDIEFHTPVYRNLLEMYKNAILQGLEPTAAWFIQNGPPDLVTKVVNLTEDKWQVSERWQQHEIYIPKETDHLLDVAHDSVVRLKKQFIEQLEQEILAEMRQAEAQPDDEAVLRLLTHYQHLCQQRVALAKPLGSVVSAR
ncbi:MAG: toprim domain-containing protein, partial [Bernardetiaceae bacterium]|nr:toprim domain-containing protein [Bernardetiaceae bacterium]